MKHQQQSQAYSLSRKNSSSSSSSQPQHQAPPQQQTSSIQQLQTTAPQSGVGYGVGHKVSHKSPSSTTQIPRVGSQSFLSLLSLGQAQQGQSLLLLQQQQLHLSNQYHQQQQQQQQFAQLQLSPRSSLLSIPGSMVGFNNIQQSGGGSSVNGSEVILTETDMPQPYLTAGHQNFIMNLRQHSGFANSQDDSSPILLKRHSTFKNSSEDQLLHQTTLPPHKGHPQHFKPHHQPLGHASSTHGSGLMMTMRTNSEILDENPAQHHNENSNLSSPTMTAILATIPLRRKMQTSMQIVECQHQSLSALPAWVCDMKNSLAEVNLSFNKFTSFPNELCQFVHLRVLSMENNLITRLPEEVAFLKHLEELSLRHNLLVELPPTLQNLQMLRVLDVSQNRLTRVASETTNLHRLEALYIANNDFTRLPARLLDLRNSLKEISLDWFKYVKHPIPVITTDRNALDKLFHACYTATGTPGLTFRQFLEIFSSFGQQQTSSSAIGLKQTVSWKTECRMKVFAAAENEDIGVLSSLLEDSPEVVNALDSFGQTVLIASLMSAKSSESSARIAKVLLDFGADPAAGAGQLGCALHIAASRLNVEAVALLSQPGRSNGTTHDVNVSDFEGNSALHIAMSGFAKDTTAAREVVQLLLKAGADPNAKNLEGWTPLHVAVRKNQRAAVNFAAQWNSSQAAAADKDESNFEVEEEEVGKLIQPSGLDTVTGKSILPSMLECVTAKSCLTAIQVSAMMQQRSALDVTTSKVVTDVTRKSQQQEPRKPSEEREDAEAENIALAIVARFFDFEADGGPNKWTALHIAASQGNIPMIEILAEANASPFLLTKLGQTVRKVALQSLILFKVLRKQELRWWESNIFLSRASLTADPYRRNFFVGGGAAEAMEERNVVHNLHGFIEQSMRWKEHFLRQEESTEDEKEFGYTIKVNFQDNRAEPPRNKELCLARQQNGEGGIGDRHTNDDDDDIEDPDMYPRTHDEDLLLPTRAQREATPMNGTVKTKEIRERREEDGEEGEVNSEAEDMSDQAGCFTNGIDEGGSSCYERGILDEENGRVKFHNDTAFAKHVAIADPKPRMSDTRGTAEVEVVDQTNGKAAAAAIEEAHLKEAFTQMWELDSIHREDELKRLADMIVNEESAFSRSLWSLLVIRLLHVRLSSRSMKFHSERGTLPRSIHIFNEFLFSRLNEGEVEMLYKDIPRLLEKLLDILFQRLAWGNEEGSFTPTYHPINASQVNPVVVSALPTQQMLVARQQQAYQRLNCLAIAHRTHMRVWSVIRSIRDTLIGLNSVAFLGKFAWQCSEYFQDGKKRQREIVEADSNVAVASSEDNRRSSTSSQQATVSLSVQPTILAFSTSDFSAEPLVEFENMQSLLYATRVCRRGGNDVGYCVVGSPKYYYDHSLQQQQQQHAVKSRVEEKQTKRQNPSKAVQKPNAMSNDNSENQDERQTITNAQPKSFGQQPITTSNVAGYKLSVLKPGMNTNQQHYEQKRSIWETTRTGEENITDDEDEENEEAMRMSSTAAGSMRGKQKASGGEYNTLFVSKEETTKVEKASELFCRQSSWKAGLHRTRDQTWQENQ